LCTIISRDYAAGTTTKRAWRASVTRSILRAAWHFGNREVLVQVALELGYRNSS
jgi:hypothetical protein